MGDIKKLTKRIHKNLDHLLEVQRKDKELDNFTPKEIGFNYDSGILNCPCGWQGKDVDCNEKRVDTMFGSAKSGWKGYKYYCPKCDRYIAKWTLMVS